MLQKRHSTFLAFTMGRVVSTLKIIIIINYKIEEEDEG
jgi:hypothetical protein